MHVVRPLAATAALLLSLSWGAAAQVPVDQDPVPRYPGNYKILIDNDRVRVLDFRLRKGDTEEFHSHPAHVLYVLEPFKIMFKLPGGRTAIREAKAGEVLYSDAVMHSPTNIGDTDAHGILVELKTETAGQAVQEERAESQLTEVLTAVTFIRGKPGADQQVKSELLSLTGPTRGEPGNLGYDLYQSADHPGEFMRLEVWRNAEALELHKASPYLKASFERRKDQGWQTEITRWIRVPEEAAEERRALGLGK
jgi:quinol monooxygenase YgiN/quercetin dioxygenase-like cupin family protein